MTEVEQFHRFLLERAEGRVRIEQEMLWRALRVIHPELAVTAAARARLRDLIDQLALDGECETPKSREGWDQSSLPVLPKWIRLSRPANVVDETDLRSIPWAPELRFLAAARTDVPLDELLKLQRFFAEGGRKRPIVPAKERSLQIFGDEKTLDDLRRRTLFRADRLSLAALRCEAIGEPLAWKRGPDAAAPVIIIENAATWHSYCRWNETVRRFSAVIYGKGLQAAESIAYLHDVFAFLGGPRLVLYFGDLDPTGLRIPQQGSAYAQAHGLPPVEPHLWSYHQLLSLGDGKAAAWDGELASRVDCEWLGDLTDAAWTILSAGKRLAQEHVGWEFLSSAQ